MSKWVRCKNAGTSLKLCFNCTGAQLALACKSKRTCQMYQRQHHTSIYDKSGNMVLATESLLIHPVVVLKVNSVTCCALLDTGARSYYASAALIKRLKVTPIQKETNNIDWYDDYFNNQKTRSSWCRYIRFDRKICTNFEGLPSGEKYIFITTKSKI